jgi:hypothetical protein
MNNRFIRMNLSNQSWGFQLLPNPKKQEGMVFPEYPAHFSTLTRILGKMFEVIQVFPNYEISLGPVWFYTKEKNELGEVKSTMEVNPLVDARIYENIIELESYNQEEMITLVKTISYQSYKTISGFRLQNKFILRIHFKNEEELVKAKFNMGETK